MYYKNVYKHDSMKRGEHMAVRECFGWYLWTHHLIEVKGQDAAAFLDKIMMCNIANLKNGSERYTPALKENGEIFDDVVVIRLEDELFWVSTLFPMKLIPWMEKHKADMCVAFAKITEQWDMYAVQGPKALEAINLLVETPVDDQKFFTIRDNFIDGIPVKINRAGFTGEKLGYEIYIAPDKYPELESKLKHAAQVLGGRQVTDFQIMAMTLPTEAGYYYMRDLMFRNPYEVGLTRGIGWGKGFIGEAALAEIRDAGAKKEMLGVTFADEDLDINHAGFGGPGDAVMLNGEEIGRMAKLTYSYILDTNIGYIIAQKGAVKAGDEVLVNGHKGIITPSIRFI